MPTKTWLRTVAFVLTATAGALAPFAPCRAAVLIPRVLDTRTYAETYTAIADLADGTYVQVQLGVSNLGWNGPRGTCRLLIADGKQTWEDGESFSRDAWTATTKPVDRLSMGNACRMSDGAEPSVSARVGGRTVRIDFARALTPMRPPDARVIVAGKFYDGQILDPWSAVRVRERDGNGALVTEVGFGYWDHSRSTVLPRALAAGWVRFRGLHAKKSLLALVRLTDKQGRGDGWLWRQGHAIRTFQVRGLGGLASVAAGGRLSWRPVTGPAVAIEIGALLHHAAPVQKYGILGRVIEHWVGNPVTNTFRARLVEAGRPPVSGILEVSFDDE